MARVGVISFPGSNCERETLRSFARICKDAPRLIWHKETKLDGLDLVVLPGGFSYGDYLRAGAIARFSPIMAALQNFAAKGGYVLGICNGFQILTEAKLLPGALIKNRNLKFISKTLTVRVEQTNTPWTCMCKPGQVLALPVAHGEGNFVHHLSDLTQLEANQQVLLRYTSNQGKLSEEANPNGSQQAIAGIVNTRGNVFGLMPHPERFSDVIYEHSDGRFLLESIITWIDQHGVGQ